MPLISVIVPVYKTEPYLKKCIDSLLCQTLKDIEIILVNDGSPDNSAAICDKYAALDARVKVIHKNNGGLSSARNAALDICSGDYIGFVDSDDFVAPNMFEELYQSSIMHNSDISICAHCSFNDSSSSECLLPFDKKVYHNEEIKNFFIVPLLGKNRNEKIPYLEGFVWRQLFKRSIIGDIRFKSERKYFAEDVMFDFDIYPKCNTISVVNKPLYFYRYNDQSLSNKYRKNVWDMLSNYLLAEFELIDRIGIKSDNSINERLNNIIIQFTVFSVKNLGKTDCDLIWKEKILELKKIGNDKYVKRIFKFSVIKIQPLKVKLLLLLLKYKMYTTILILNG